MDYIVVSDIHVGNTRTPATHIAQSFTDNILTEQNKTLDVIFLAGDFADRRLQMDTTEAQVFIQLCVKLLRYCHDNNIILRVLEGTRSHDWLQSAMVVKINEAMDSPVDLKHVKTLEIEYIPKINKHVLYIPDEWCHTQEDLYTEIQDKLTAMNIHQVDIAILHGQFSYQTKGLNTSALSYDEVYFHELVTGYIHIGHYHTHSTFDRIIAQGSLDRLSHGEEEDKGYVRVHNSSWTFIPNPNAKVYKTIKITPAYTLAKLDKAIFSTPPGSYIRLIAPPEHELSQAFEDLRLRYKAYHLKKQSNLKASEDVSVTYITDDSYLTQCEHFIQSSNIYDSLISSVTQKQTLTQQEHAKFLSYSQVFKDCETQPSAL